MISVYKKELRSYFTSLTGYVAISLILVLTGIFIKVIAFDNRYTFIENALPSASIIMLLAVPIITMSSFAGERAQKTDTLLCSLPLSTSKIVLGKYFAMLTVLSVPVAVIALVPLVLSMYGTVSYFGIYSALITFFLLISAMIAICTFMSSLVESQVIAAVLGSGALIACYFANLLTSVGPRTENAAFFSFQFLAIVFGLFAYAFTKNHNIPFAVWGVLFIVITIIHIENSGFFLGILGKTVDLFALFDRFADTVKSKVFDVNTAVYYLSIAIFFNVLTVQTVEKRRYS